jgi:hypothetical protein
MSTALTDVLRVWREAERVLDTLPPQHPDREALRAIVGRLNRAYQELSDPKRAEVADRPASDGVIQQASALLANLAQTT